MNSTFRSDYDRLHKKIAHTEIILDQIKPGALDQLTRLIA